MDDIAKLLLNYGFPGLMCLILLWYNKQQDTTIKSTQAALVAEKEARVADAKAYTALALDLQAKVMAAVTTLAEVSRSRNP